MATVYYLKCKSCGSNSGEVSDYLELYYNDEYIVLPHPGEYHTLRGYGYTKDSAKSAGCLHNNDGYVCLKCGNVFYVRSLVLPYLAKKPSRAELIVLYIIVTPILAFLIFNGYNILYSLFVVIMFVILTDLISGYINRKRIVKDEEDLCPINSKCTKCDSGNIMTIDDYAIDKKRLMLCESCGKKEVFCESVGMS